MAGIAARLRPLLNRVLIQKAEKITQTKGGIMIPEKAAGKVIEGTVVAVGPGSRKPDGEFVKPALNVGDTVLLPEYGGTKVELENKEFHIYQETDILAKVDAS